MSEPIVATFIDIARHVPRSHCEQYFAWDVETQLLDYGIVKARPSAEVPKNCFIAGDIAKTLVDHHSPRFLFRARTLNQIGLPMNLNAARISFARNRS